jgi:uncharacterized delta-60 repeat protein
MPDTACRALTLLALSILVAAPARAQTLLSQTTWGGPSFEVAEGLALASDASAYVVGRTGSFIQNHGAIFVVKFAPDGTAVTWQRTWEAPNPFVDDVASDVAVGPDGSVYVTGTTLGVRGDVLLLKFDADGALVWQRTWGRGPSDNDNGQAVATAPDGSIYVAGGTTNIDTGLSSLLLLKFAPDGTLAWQRVWESGASSNGLAVGVGPDGSVYAAGTTPRPDVPFEFDVSVLKIAADGTLVWQRSYAAGEIADPRGGLTVAADGSIYVAGGLQEPQRGIVDLAVLLIKLAPDGSLVWDRTWGGRSGDSPADVTAAADGTVLVAGQSNSFAVGSDDAFFVRFLPTGKIAAAATWGGAGLDAGAGVGVAADGTIALGASAEAPPYSLLRAPTKASRPRGSLTIPSGSLTDAGGAVSDPAGVVGTPNGSTTFAGSFEAALVRIAP